MADWKAIAARSWKTGAGALGPLMALVFVVALFGILDELFSGGHGRFLTERNLRTVTVQTVVVAVASLGMTAVIIAGGIDLSAGTTISLAATVLAWMLRADYPPSVAVAACLATGLAAGLTNGLLISALRVVPFIVTLGTMIVYLGMGNAISGNIPIQPAPDQVPRVIPDLVRNDPDNFLLRMPTGVWLTLLLAVALALVLRYTVFGRHVFALGSNESTARLCGINVPGTKIAVYGLGGLLFGIAGVCQFALLETGAPTSGRGMELNIIAAVVIGGASLSGGRGSVLGTLAGAAIMQIIASGCTQIGLPDQTQLIVTGLVIIGAVALDEFRQRRLNRE